MISPYLADVCNRNWETLPDETQPNGYDRRAAPPKRPIQDASRCGRLAQRNAELSAANATLQAEVADHWQAVEALRESEDRFHGAFDYAAIGMALVAPNGHWLKVNNALCELLGYSAHELLTLTFQALTYPDDLATDLAYVERMLTGEIDTYQMEKRYLHKRGHLVWGLLSVALVRDARGAPLYFVSQIQDITERKRTQETLQRSEAHFRSLIEKMSDTLTIIDKDGTVRYQSPALEQALGYKPEERIGQSGFDLLHAEDVPKARDTLAYLIQNPGATVSREFQFRHKDGSFRVQEAVGVSLFDDPTVAGIVIRYRDITEHKRMEEKLRAERDFISQIIQGTPALICGISPEGTTTFINPAVENVTGYPAAELIGQNWWRTFYPGEEYQQVDQLFQAFTHGAVRDYEMVLTTKTGEKHTVAWNSLNRFDEQGRLLEIVGFGVDVTERKRAETATVCFSPVFVVSTIS